MVVRLSALRTSRLYPQEILLLLISVKRLSRPQGHSAIGRILCLWKIPVTLDGIEPATYRFVAQHINHCATRVPVLSKCCEKLCWGLSKPLRRSVRVEKYKCCGCLKTLVRDGNIQECFCINSYAIEGLFYVECSMEAKCRPVSLFNFKTFLNIVAIPWTLLCLQKIQILLHWAAIFLFSEPFEFIR